jgi:hypothetical protein
MNGSRKDTNGFEAAGTARQYAVSAGNRGGMIVLTSELLVGAASKFQRHSSRKLPRRCFCAGLHGLERRGMPAARQQITDHRSHGLPLSTGTGMALGSVKPVWARKIGTDRVLFESPRDTFQFSTSRPRPRMLRTRTRDQWTHFLYIISCNDGFQAYRVALSTHGESTWSLLIAGNGDSSSS